MKSINGIKMQEDIPMVDKEWYTGYLKR